MRIRLLLALPLLATTAGCDIFDPYKREGTWRPTAANERNLATMAVIPAERVQGTGAAGAAGFTAAGAIDRLRVDRVKPLPDTGLARIITVPGGGGN
ncbi:hypothetical protein [Dankookia sp. P2]|uniref:hypothetical protein n=1 Tax=Dankookia sp. P2 TaxID=3423955 RepID=UPI003D6746E1